MKKNYLSIGCFVISTALSKAQSTADSAQVKPSRSEIELVYSFYLQDGDHSAVTGGEGTEELTVHAVSAKLKNQRGKRTLSLHTGSDLITSASTDRIDHVLSSASRKDTRTYLNLGYARAIEKRLELGATAGFSIESDYLSYSEVLSMSKTAKNDMHTFSASLHLFQDDLRWGRLNSDYYRPVGLIYPYEIDHIQWFDIYRRFSYTLKMGWSQIINRRNVLGIFPEISHQRGLLSTPFHRVYFNEGSLKVENLPQSRNKIGLSLRWNSFVGGRLVLKNNLQVYSDDWGVQALTLEQETVVKWLAAWSLAPFARWYVQGTSSHFAPYAAHTPDERFYSSDYDLSAFQAVKAGLRLKYFPLRAKLLKWDVDGCSLEYAWYWRSDGLRAHILSLSFDFGKNKG